MSLRSSLVSALLCAVFVGLAGSAQADVANTEIEHLLTTLGESGCRFVRNGKEYPASDAESHLRLKYRKGARYVSSAESFIDRLASASSMTRKPYQVRCPDEPEVTAKAWLQSVLLDYRRVGESTAS